MWVWLFVSPFVPFQNSKSEYTPRICSKIYKLNQGIYIYIWISLFIFMYIYIYIYILIYLVLYQKHVQSFVYIVSFISIVMFSCWVYITSSMFMLRCSIIVEVFHHFHTLSDGGSGFSCPQLLLPNAFWIPSALLMFFCGSPVVYRCLGRLLIIQRYSANFL